MGRVKLQIKKIENTTNRQVTFSKRRNGLIKKAYELSVLCDVDVGLIMFSPSGRVSIFSGNKSIEEIVARYINLPEHERGRLQNQEYLQRAISRLQDEAQDHHIYHHPSPVSDDSQLEEIQHDIIRCKSQLLDTEKRLRVFEGDPSEITTLCEAEYRQQILEQTLKHVCDRKQFLLEDKYNSTHVQAASQVSLPSEAMNVNGMVTINPNNITSWLPQRDPQVQMMDFMNFNGLSPREHPPQRINGMLSSASSVGGGQNVEIQEYLRLGSRMEDDDDDDDNGNIVQQPEFGQVINVNLSPWTHVYPTGNGGLPVAQPRERQFSDIFLSQFSP